MNFDFFLKDIKMIFLKKKMNMVDRSDLDDDLDEPMASQSVDSEAPLTHNSSKNNFFASPDEAPPQMMGSAPRGSFKNTVFLIQFREIR